MQDGTLAVLLVTVVGFCIYAGSLFGGGAIRDECNRFGRTSIFGVMYVCTPEKKSP